MPPCRQPVRLYRDKGGGLAGGGAQQIKTSDVTSFPVILASIVIRAWIIAEKEAVIQK